MVQSNGLEKDVAGGHFTYSSLPAASINDAVHVSQKPNCRVKSSQGSPAQVTDLSCVSWQGCQLFRATYHSDAEFALNNKSDIVAFFFPSQGQIELTLKSGKVLASDEPVAIRGIDCQKLVLRAGVRHLRICVPLSRFNLHLARSNTQSIHRQIEFISSPKLSAETCSILRNMADAIFEEVLKQGRQPAEFASSIELLELTLLELWPNTDLRRSSVDQANIVPRHVRQAMDLFRAAPFDRHELAAVAAACSVSTRTLQLGFRRFCECSPFEYLDDIRLKLLLHHRSDQAFWDRASQSLGRSAMRRLRRVYRIHYGMDPASRRGVAHMGSPRNLPGAEAAQ